MLQNAYSLGKIGADTAENERNFAEICQKLATTLRVPTEPAMRSGSREVHGAQEALARLRVRRPGPQALHEGPGEARARLGPAAAFQGHDN